MASTTACDVVRIGVTWADELKLGFTFHRYCCKFGGGPMPATCSDIASFGSFHTEPVLQP